LVAIPDISPLVEEPDFFLKGKVKRDGRITVDIVNPLGGMLDKVIVLNPDLFFFGRLPGYEPPKGTDKRTEVFQEA
jgi:hypothetical protein